MRADSHACVAIKNGAIAPNTPVTLVNPMSPQSFVEAQVSGDSKDACPISQEVPPGVESYDIALQNASSSTLPKQTPFIAVIGTAASSAFNVVNNNVQADLNQTHTTNTFRACGANDGVYLTVWRGVPLTGTLVWSGHYYEAGNPGTLPTCTAAESTPHPQ